MSFKCKECDKEFGTEPAMHRHIKIHDMTLADYYTKNFPRKNLLTGELLPFKNKIQPLIESCAENISDPEARSMATKSLNTLNNSLNNNSLAASIPNNSYTSTI